MNYKTTAFILLLFISGCTNNNELSDAYGNFEAETVIVSSETTGRILQFNAEQGRKIEPGFLAAIVDTIPFHLKIRQIEAQQAAIRSQKQSVYAQIAIFEEQKKILKTNEKRIVHMLADGAATQKQLDEITGQINVINKQAESTKTKLTAVQKELEVMETQMATIRDQLNRCKITAPTGGTILETYADAGELAATGKPLFKMASLEVLTLKVYVSGAQLPNLKLGQEVHVLTDKSETENREFAGTVTWISPEAEFTPKIIQTKEERVKLVYAVKIAVKNDGSLKIGMPGEVRWQ